MKIFHSHKRSLAGLCGLDIANVWVDSGKGSSTSHGVMHLSDDQVIRLWMMWMGL